MQSNEDTNVPSGHEMHVINNATEKDRLLPHHAEIEHEEVLKVPSDRIQFYESIPRKPPLRRSRSVDRTDNESIRAVPEEDEREPSALSLEPCETEKFTGPAQSYPDFSLSSCFNFNRSQNLDKKCNDLFLSIHYHEVDKLKEILEEDPPVLAKLFTRRDNNGLPCIMKAIARQSLGCIRLLLDEFEQLDFKKFGIDQMDALQSDGKRNALHIAAQVVRGKEIIEAIAVDSIMKLLADYEDNQETTPLIVACEYQNHAFVVRLIKYGAKIDHVNIKGYSPLYWAAANGSAMTLKILLEQGVRSRDLSLLELFKNCKIYNGMETIIEAILLSKDPETLKVCLSVQEGQEIIKQCLKQLERKPTFIHSICETPLIKLVELAVEDNLQLLKRQDENGTTPLIRAIKANQNEVAKRLLEIEVNGTMSQKEKPTYETALIHACKLQNYDIIIKIMEISDNDLSIVDADERNIFHHAAKHDEVLSIILEYCTRDLKKYENYERHLTQADKNGYVPLHYAASSGAWKNVKLLLANGVPHDSRSFHLERTPLHYAAFSNIETVRALVDHVTNRQQDVSKFVNAVDSNLQTCLHLAAYLGKWQTVSYLLEHGATITGDKERETPVHMAATSGCIRTIECLIRNDRTAIDVENLVGETPVMFAAAEGNKQALNFLLENGASLWGSSHCDSVEKRKTCLDWAVLAENSDIAKSILDCKNWREAMEKSCYGADGLLAKMVDSMPHVALEVLKKCEEPSSGGKKYDFFALQTTEGSSGCGKPGQYVTALKSLKAMVNHSRDECLSHDVVQRFLHEKWVVGGRKCYMLMFFIYGMFLLALTAYATFTTLGYVSGESPSCNASRIVCCIFGVFSLVKGIFQLVHRRLKYFNSVSAYLELAMYICVFIFIPNDKKSNMQQQAGAIAVFLAWITFTWFLKRFQTYGIYIIMVNKIFITFVKVFVPVSFFLMAFSMAFFVLFHKEDAGFDNIVKSFVTSFAMMVGEVDYRDTFLQNKGENFALRLVFLVLFLIVVGILLMNLLTGLAVGDIGMIMKRSFIESQRQQAMLIIDIDHFLGRYPGFKTKYLERLIVTKKKHRHNFAIICFQKLVDLMYPRLNIEYDNNTEKNHECNEIAQLKCQLSKVQKTLEEINSSLKKGKRKNPNTKLKNYFSRRHTLQ